jgi:hypothetical protein
MPRDRRAPGSARRSINPWNVFPAEGKPLNLRDFDPGIDKDAGAAMQGLTILCRYEGENSSAPT